MMIGNLTYGSDEITYRVIENSRLETRVRILTESALATVLPGVIAPASPFMAGMVIRTSDAGTAARRVLEGIPTVEAPAGVMVPPEYAAGAAVVFA